MSNRFLDAIRHGSSLDDVMGMAREFVEAKKRGDWSVPYEVSIASALDAQNRRCKYSKMVLLRNLLNVGVDPQKELHGGMLLVRFLLRRSNIRAMRLVLKHGASVNEKDEDPSYWNNSVTLVSEAITRLGAERVSKALSLLKRYGADFEAHDRYNTLPAVFAARRCVLSKLLAVEPHALARLSEPARKKLWRDVIADFRNKPMYDKQVELQRLVKYMTDPDIISLAASAFRDYQLFLTVCREFRRRGIDAATVQHDDRTLLEIAVNGAVPPEAELAIQYILQLNPAMAREITPVQSLSACVKGMLFAAGNSHYFLINCAEQKYWIPHPEAVLRAPPPPPALLSPPTEGMTLMELPSDILILIVQSLAHCGSSFAIDLFQLRLVCSSFNTLIAKTDATWKQAVASRFAKTGFEGFTRYWKAQLNFRRAKLVERYRLGWEYLVPCAGYTAPDNRNLIVARDSARTNLILMDVDSRAELSRVLMGNQSDFALFRDLRGGVWATESSGTCSLYAFSFPTEPDGAAVTQLSGIPLQQLPFQLQVFGNSLACSTPTSIRVYNLETGQSIGEIASPFAPPCALIGGPDASQDASFLTVAGDNFELFDLRTTPSFASGSSSTATSAITILKPSCSIPLSRLYCSQLLSTHQVSEYRHVVISRKSFYNVDIRMNRAFEYPFAIERHNGIWKTRTYHDWQNKRLVLSETELRYRFMDLTYEYDDSPKFTYFVAPKLNFLAEPVAAVLVDNKFVRAGHTGLHVWSF